MDGSGFHPRCHEYRQHVGCPGKQSISGPARSWTITSTTKVFSSIDFGGRYAYSNQPAIAQWNIAQFATTLVPLIDADVDQSVKLATQVVESFSNEFENAWLEVFGRKIGLLPTRNDSQLIVALLELMAEGNADFTLTFRNLSEIGNLAEIGSGISIRIHFPRKRLRMDFGLAEKARNGIPIRFGTTDSHAK